MGSSVSRDIDSPRVRRIDESGLPPADDGPCRPTPGTRLGRSIVLSAVLGTTVLGVALLVRRLTTAFVPLPPLTLIAVGTLLAGVVLGLRWLWRWSGGESTGLEARGLKFPPLQAQLVSSCLLLLLGAGLSVPGTGWGPWLLFWFMLGGVEAIGWKSLARARAIEPVTDRVTQVQAFRGEGTLSLEERLGRDEPPRSQRLAFWSSGKEREKSDENGEGSLRQQVSRVVHDGQEILRGAYRCEFEDNERQQTIHVVFSPPFSVPPQVEAACSASSHIVLKVAQAETFGARLELRRRGDELPRESMLVKLTASAPWDGRSPRSPILGSWE